MASRFVIREKTFGGFCTSQKYVSFNTDLQEAALYVSRENAQKAAVNMFKYRAGRVWSIVNPGWPVRSYHDSNLQEYIEDLESRIESCDRADGMRVRQLTELLQHLRETAVELRCDMEVVEVKLTIV